MIVGAVELQELPEVAITPVPDFIANPDFAALAQVKLDALVTLLRHFRAGRANNVILDSGRRRCVSLMEQQRAAENALIWVHWDRVDDFYGRVVPLDWMNRLKYIGPREKQHFDRSKLTGIIHTSLKMVRSTGIFRTDISEDVLAMYRFYMRARSFEYDGRHHF